MDRINQGDAVPDRKSIIKTDGLLLLTAIIWGSNFAAQRSGMSVIGPFAFSAARFALGALVLIPLLILSKRRNAGPARPGIPDRAAWAGLAGVVLFIASNLQQVGLVSTTAGNAGFITCLYVVLVPLFAFFAGKASGALIWAGALLAVAGLWILSIGAGFTMAPGDGLELVGAFFWTLHILLISRLASRMEALEIAVGQFAVCAALSAIVALAREPAPFAGLLPAAVPILFGGIFSIGVAYTLQIVAQKTAHPAHASIILSMEALFAGIGGVLLLDEPLTLRLVAGGTLMLAGMVVSQWQPARRPEAQA
jgi:drug/metabolite transporter (DMT)-like permease